MIKTHSMQRESYEHSHQTSQVSLQFVLSLKSLRSVQVLAGKSIRSWIITPTIGRCQYPENLRRWTTEPSVILLTEADQRQYAAHSYPLIVMASLKPNATASSKKKRPSPAPRFKPSTPQRQQSLRYRCSWWTRPIGTAHGRPKGH